MRFAELMKIQLACLPSAEAPHIISISSPFQSNLALPLSLCNISSYLARFHSSPAAQIGSSVAHTHLTSRESVLIKSYRLSMTFNLTKYTRAHTHAETERCQNNSMQAFFPGT
jgi:hypothetical protein